VLDEMHQAPAPPGAPRSGPPGEWGGRPRALLLVVLVLAAGGAIAVAAVGRSHGRAPTTTGAGASVPPTAIAPVLPVTPTTPQPNYAAVVARLAHKGAKVYCGSAHGNQIALTFDDGPGPRTRAILRMLTAAKVPATFFLIGELVQLHPEIPRLEVQLGMVLGDHTESHPDLTKLGAPAVRQQLSDARDAIEAASGVPVTLFRPPYGARNGHVDAQARALGLLEVLWDVDTRDSERAPANKVAANARRGLRGGSIVLMHEDAATVQALPQILRSLRRRHLEPVTIPQLVAAGHRTRTCPYIPNTE
jgi:peptidoglycan/xylan/chitin deacetylase (PgdA/CDA1 family)